MNTLFKISAMLFVSALSAFILSCEVIGTENEKNEKIETALLLDFINYSGEINYYVDEDQELYSNYALGFYSSVISGTMICANSDAIAGRYIMISFQPQSAGTYTGSGNISDNAYIIIADGYNFTWASNRANGRATIIISKYGDVGDTIEGKFSGTLKHECNCSTLKIENGKFAVRRKADQ